MPSSTDARIIEQFVHQLGTSKDAERIGRSAAVLWAQIGIRLSPILGNDGVRALYARTVFVTARRFPTLVTVPDSSQLSDALEQLKRFLNGLERDEAHEIAIALFREFHDLMTRMVGHGLTSELLGSSWDLPLPDNPTLNTE
jgi:hypothetical protein